MRASLLLGLVLVVTGAPGSSLAQGQNLSVIRTVADDDTNRGIRCKKISLIRTNGTWEQFGASNSEGIKVIPVGRTEPCYDGMVIEVVPDTARYVKSRKDVECTNPEVVRVLPFNRRLMENHETNNLLQNIDNLAATDAPALEALLYSDISGQVALADQNLSQDYYQRAQSALANATGFPGEPVGADGGRISEFTMHLMQYQQSVGLKPTGIPNYETFATAADRDIGSFRHAVYADPGDVARRSEPACLRLTSSDVMTGGESTLVTALVRAAEERESAGEYGKAALFFNEAHARVDGNTMMSVYTEHLVYENAGRALNVPVPVLCDPIQRRFVMSPAMVEAIRARQQVEPTGILDYQTLRSLANIDVGPFLARQTN